MRGCGEEISNTVTDCVSRLKPAAHAVSPEPRPTTATRRGAAWTTAGRAPSTVWTPPKGSQLLPLPFTDSRRRTGLRVAIATTPVASSSKSARCSGRVWPCSLRHSSSRPGSAPVIATSAIAAAAKRRPW
jgi:hypothetical protein